MVTLALAGVLTMWLHLNLWVTLVVLAVLFVASFAIVWHISGFLIRARAVLTVLAVLVTANILLKHLAGPVLGNVIAVAIMIALVLIPVTARFLWLRAWCVLDRHRLRACLRVSKIRTMNLDGSLPLMVWARPTKTGERVWLWLRAGACSDDIEDALPYIASTCFARDARLHRVRKLTTLVAVEIIRRDPLAAGEKIPSPLSQLAELLGTKVKGEGTESIRPVKVTDITTEVHTITTLPTIGHKPTKTPNTMRKSVEPTVVVSGEDLSDYVD